ncbi:hypothetical protein BDN72DRAFT_856031 [Pluteus cervinus]|uniref:Uncharacterized protein n=1 Tax=Pluteus cervinus TaxID=181527 RepID=A0ACD3B2C7_9AGAR|nr:hypothetical protein BDN72DRAFT_856031 [Pluteus cervinus]
MSAAPLPTALYEGLLKKLVDIIDLVHKGEGATTPQAKQALRNATNELRASFTQAKDIAINLPGGEMLVEEQDDVLEMLTKLRNQKREQLIQFMNRSILSSSANVESKMDIDSMASTPFHGF